MNNITLFGNLTRDPELKTAGKGKNERAYLNFTLAVQRPFKNKDDEYDTDFINCIAFGQTAQFIREYFSKGSKMGIIGRLEDNTYLDEEREEWITRYSVVANSVYFGGENKGSGDKSKGKKR